jgi:hypothetical protein
MAWPGEWVIFLSGRLATTRDAMMQGPWKDFRWPHSHAGTV